MELRRATTTLLRSGGSLTNLLVPYSAPRWTAGSQLSCTSLCDQAARRTFVSTSRQNAMRPPPRPTKAAPPTAEGADTSPRATFTPVAPEIESANSLGWTAPTQTNRSSPDLNAEQQHRESVMNSGLTSADLLSQLNFLSSARTASPVNTRNVNFQNMLNPTLAPSSRDLLGENAASFLPKSKPPLELTLKPLLGRTITLHGNVDVGRAFKKLEQECARNKVRADFTRQRFHERAGLKRKRLRKERWRRRFMEGFKATVGRVKELKRQGW